MAECSYARCMQERRTIKKRLQKWTKNCIYTLGFERVAEEFMGRRQWRVYQERVLKSWCPSIERDIEVKDWDPTEDQCRFCDLESTERDTDEERISPVQSDKLHHNNNIDLLGSDSSDSSEGLPGSMNALESVSSMAAIAALTSPPGLPFYPAAGFPRWYLSPPPPVRNLLENVAKPESPMAMNAPPTTVGAEMPLDLSAKSSKSPSAESPENIRVPSMIDPKPSLFSSDWSSCRSRPRMSPMSGRRTYTEDELQAALRDIQSGKLGTRRAAVIYGIPRSTLRNKVYKLALERERDSHVLLGAPLPRPSPPDPATIPPSLIQPEREESSLEEDKESSSQPSLSMEDLLRLSGVERGPQSSVLASYLAQLLKLKENVSPGDEEVPFIKKLIEERKNGVEEDQSNVILRIPSFKPNAEPTEKPAVNGDSAEVVGGLREAIAKSITHKFQSEPLTSAAYPPHPSLHQQQQHQHQQQQQHSQHHSHHQHQQHQHQQRQNSQGKGTRPKRGKYRNYDRDSLVEAVRAVQRGEMSVHRAGSYYGVPHSTLEYKVKERHLMRPRKREPKNENEKSSKSLPSPLPLDKSKQPQQQQQQQQQQPPIAPKPMGGAATPFPPLNGLKLPPSLFDTGVPPHVPYGGAPFPFWPPHPFPLPTAEQMFPPSLPAATRRFAESLYDGSGHSGNFLDGIIRSSLELGMKNAADKSEKAMSQHMTNKALIDQLCLSSRIPPGGLIPAVQPVPPAPRSTDTTHSDDERNVPYDLSRSSDDDSDDRTKRTDDNDIPTADEDEDIDNISNHASEDDEPQDS